MKTKVPSKEGIFFLSYTPSSSVSKIRPAHTIVIQEDERNYKVVIPSGIKTGPHHCHTPTRAEHYCEGEPQKSGGNVVTNF